MDADLTAVIVRNNNTIDSYYSGTNTTKNSKLSYFNITVAGKSAGFY